MENMVFSRLKYLGYKIKEVGQMSLQIMDFVAEKNDKNPIFPATYLLTSKK